MLDLWSGLYAALIGGVVGVVGSVVGAVITGRFMLAQQELEGLRRASQAMRALLVELEDNRLFMLDVLRRSHINCLEPSLDLARLRRFVWDAQLPLLAIHLDDEARAAVAQAYRSSESLRDSVRGNIRLPDDAYEITDAQNTMIINTHERLEQAIAAVRLAAGMPGAL